MVSKNNTQLTLHIPNDLYIMLKKLSADTGLSMREIILQYLRYLKCRKNRHKEILNEQSDNTFNLDTDKPR